MWKYSSFASAEMPQGLQEDLIEVKFDEAFARHKYRKAGIKPERAAPLPRDPADAGQPFRGG
jgi:hypothetical protein